MQEADEDEDEELEPEQDEVRYAEVTTDPDFEELRQQVASAQRGCLCQASGTASCLSSAAKRCCWRCWHAAQRFKRAV